MAKLCVQVHYSVEQTTKLQVMTLLKQPLVLCTTRVFPILVLAELDGLD